MSASAVHLAGISRSFAARYVLRNLDLDVRAGEAVAITGANGAGKTTLLRIISTLLAPSSGEVNLFGVRVDGAKTDLRRRIGALLAEGYLFNDLTVMENLSLFARLYGLSDAPARIGGWLERLRMTAFSDARVGTLSRGERQRIALIRSLLHEPELLLWDEPTTGLDAEARRALKAIGRERKGRATLLLVTHDATVGEGWIDRRLALTGGALR